MPFDGGGLDITLPAAADLSAHQYKPVTIDANGRGTVCTANTDIPIGVLQNKPTGTDHPAKVRIYGLSLHKFGAAANEGDMLAAGVEGFGTVTTAASWSFGVTLLAPGGSGNIQTILVRPAKLA